MRRSVVAVLALLVTAGVGGCSSSSDVTSTAGAASGPPPSSAVATTGPAGTGPTTPAAAPVVVTIDDFAYAVSGRVSAGAMVQVKNEDSEAHTVTADAGGFDVVVAPGETKTFAAPVKPGTYAFHCTYHSGMHGALVVA